MIPVVPVAEPPNFDKRVRQKGLAAIAELIGAPTQKRRGPKRKQAGFFATPSDIKSDAFPTHWRAALDDLHTAYGGMCAYLALYLEPATGSRSVDHFVPKSKDWSKVYEWSNYRLACTFVNTHKDDRELTLDPFTLQLGLFALEFVEFQVIVGPAAQGALVDQVSADIVTLGLNLPECCEARREYVVSYEEDHIRLSYLTRRAPFIAQELRRQGRLLRGDA